jgi:hypothetical protein
VIDYLDTAEDYIVDDTAEEIEVAMDDILQDDYNDIDNIANINDETEDAFVDDEEESLEDDYDDTDHVDYMLSDN